MKIVKPLYIVRHDKGIISDFGTTNVFDSTVEAQKWINDNPLLDKMYPMEFYFYAISYRDYKGTKEEFYKNVAENWDLYSLYGQYDWWINPNSTAYDLIQDLYIS